MPAQLARRIGDLPNGGEGEAARRAGGGGGALFRCVFVAHLPIVASRVGTFASSFAFEAFFYQLRFCSRPWVLVGAAAMVLRRRCSLCFWSAACLGCLLVAVLLKTLGFRRVLQAVAVLLGPSSPSVVFGLFVRGGPPARPGSRDYWLGICCLLDWGLISSHVCAVCSFRYGCFCLFAFFPQTVLALRGPSYEIGVG